jgi:hypothetical protein
MRNEAFGVFSPDLVKQGATSTVGSSRSEQPQSSRCRRAVTMNLAMNTRPEASTTPQTRHATQACQRTKGPWSSSGALSKS